MAFDKVVFTTPASVIAGACPGLTADERRRFEKIEYQGIVCASFLSRKPLSGFYITNITDEGMPFTAVIEMTALVDRKELGGHHLVYLPKYCEPDDPLFQKSDDEVRDTFLSALERMHPSFSRNDVSVFRISRVRQVMALPTLNYSSHLPPMATSVPNLFVVNSAHIVKGVLAVDETIQVVDEALQTVLRS
jgi:protoporphyrinogen oxidase